MWNLLATYTEPAMKESKTVSIITSYLKRERDLVYLIAADKDGNIINDYIIHFKSENRLGFLQGEEAL